MGITLDSFVEKGLGILEPKRQLRAVAYGQPSTDTISDRMDEMAGKKDSPFDRIVKAEAKRLGLPENASLDEILKKQKEENARLEAERKEITPQEIKKEDGTTEEIIKKPIKIEEPKYA